MSVVSNALVQTSNEFNAAIAANTKSGKSSMDKESFLLLLVTQLQNQDPLDPAENTEFVAQLAQYSSLEQLMSLNEGMNSLTAATLEQQMLNATSYIGKEVAAAGNTISKVTDKDKNVTVSTFRYALDSNVSSGSINVYDSSNRLVYSEDIGAKNGGTTYSFTWNGLTSKGEQAPDGVYAIALSVKDADGKNILADQVVDGRVTGVLNENGVVYLGLEDGRSVKLSSVRLVSEPTVVSGGENSGTETPEPDAAAA